MDLLPMLAAASGAGGAESDENFNQTVLLLHGDGTNGAQNNTFLDSSTNNFTITRNGNTTQGSFSPFSKPDGRWGNYFDGSGDSLSYTQTGGVGSGDFTLEFWVYPVVIGDAIRNIWECRSAEGASDGFWLGSDTTDFYMYLASGKTIQASYPSANAWTHVALVRSGNDHKLYFNGSQVGSTYTAANNYSNTTIRISRYVGSDIYHHYGYLSNLRLVKGTAVYTSAFTPSTSPLTAISGTSLLTCQSNRFIDNSSNAFAITAAGNVKVTPFSPFPITTAYSPSVNGGSGYFDGSGDYLSVADNAALTASGDFTLEAWYYPVTNPADAGVISMNDGGGGGTGPRITISGSTFGFHVYNTTISAGTSVLNQWHHLVLVRSGAGSNNCACYVNGVRVGTTTNTTSQDPNGLVIGRYYTNTNNFYANAYIAGARYVVGSALYDPADTTITVPSTPPTAVTNTAFLANFTNAGIFDNTGFNNLETVGNAQIDTAVKKYGTGSMEFDGTGDGLFIPSNENFQLTGDFTIEMWFRADSLSVSGLLANNRALYEGDAFAFILGHPSYANKLSVWSRNISTSAPFLVSGTLSTGVFYHLAVTRSGSNIYLFLDGVEVDTATSTVTFSLNTLGTNIGKYWGGVFDGYIDDLRITKGVARYTTAFTPPTKAFPDL